MRDGVIISYRGASYEIGRGPTFYGIWGVGQPWPQPLEWWPDTVDGWYAVWSRFVAIERPETIVPVAEGAALVAHAYGVQVAGESSQVAVPFSRSVVAASLLAIGVACGIAGLFPDYLNGVSLAQQPFELVPHVIDFALFTASALLVLLGRGPMRVGALLAAGTCVVTFGLFFADAGTAIAGGAHAMGAGLVLGLVGWLACLTGTATAFVLSRRGAVFGRPRGSDLVPFLALSLAALGTAAAFAPPGQLRPANRRRSDGVVHRRQCLLEPGASDRRERRSDGRPGRGRRRCCAVAPDLPRSPVAGRRHHPDGWSSDLSADPDRGTRLSLTVRDLAGDSGTDGAHDHLGSDAGVLIYCVFLLALIVVTGSAILAPSPPKLAASGFTPSAPPSDRHSPATSSTPSALSPLGPEPPNGFSGASSSFADARRRRARNGRSPSPDLFPAGGRSRRPRRFAARCLHARLEICSLLARPKELRDGREDQGLRCELVP